MHRVAVACLVSCSVRPSTDSLIDVTAHEALDCSNNSPSLVLFEGSKPTECQAAVKDIASAAIRLLLSASNVSGVQCLRVPVGRDPRAQSSDSMLGPEAAQAMNQSDNTFACAQCGRADLPMAAVGSGLSGSYRLQLSRACCPSQALCAPTLLSFHRLCVLYHCICLPAQRPAQEIARWVHNERSLG